MDTNNWRPPQAGGEQPVMGGTGDWRSQWHPYSRQRIVNKIMDTLKRRLPFTGQEGLHELKKIAVRFEEKIYNAATSQSDYLRKISLKMLAMENKSQNTITNSLQTNSAGNSNRPPEPGSMDVNINRFNPYQRPPQVGGAAPIATADWKIHLMLELRQGNVNRIAEALKRHLPFSSQEEIVELHRIATRVEGDIYAVSLSKLNYQRDITLKLLTIDAHRPNQRPPWAAEEDAYWRTLLMPDSRERIVNKIFGTLKIHLPFSSQEGLLELRKIATRFEEKVYASASSQSDYIRTISLKMVTMGSHVATDPPTNLKRRRVSASGFR